jgi:hypothetical protein
MNWHKTINKAVVKKYDVFSLNFFLYELHRFVNDLYLNQEPKFTEKFLGFVLLSENL